jgi:hypothetical protein
MHRYSICQESVQSHDDQHCIVGAIERQFSVCILAH